MRSYFEGWYFKQQTKQTTLALIPAIHTDDKGTQTASIQVISNHAAYVLDSPMDAVHGRSLRRGVSFEKNRFSLQGIHLDMQTDDCTLFGSLSFSPLIPPHSDIMGPFSLVPFMECRHRVFSLFHTVNGTLRLNGDPLVFSNALGYIEGDRGHSFPKHYLWTQCSFENGDMVMLSVAEIPFLGRRFIGIIGTVLLNGHEYRIATYLGAHLAVLQADSVSVQQGTYVLQVKLFQQEAHDLRAPVQGSMTRLIRESVSCSAQYSFLEKGDLLFERSSDQASFESEW